MLGRRYFGVSSAIAVPLALFIALGGAAALGSESEAQSSLLEAGRLIYEEGRLRSGQPLKAVRPGGAEAFGSEVACALCHQKSGMGLVEGAVKVPAVIAPTLFSGEPVHPIGGTLRVAPGMEYRDYHFNTRPPYNDISLARAVREGVSPTGHSFSYLMPRYDLSEDDMQALIAYLHQLSQRPSPGVTDQFVHFSTVIAPGLLDPADREAYLDVLHACFEARHPVLPDDAPSGYKAWRLHTWELQGAPGTWFDQLQAFYQREPVFAVVSGLGLDHWQPVEEFCEAKQLPCLFPNVEVPGTPDANRYSFYFFKGVLLEAEVAARYLRDQQDGKKISRVIQISRPDGSGARAAAALRSALENSGIIVEDRLLRNGEEINVQGLLGDVVRNDAVVSWLREPDVAALTTAAPPPDVNLLLFSALLGGKDAIPLGESWRKRALIIYPYDPPSRWLLRRTLNLRPWLSEQGLPWTNERLQGNTLAACALLSEGITRMRGRYLREYLVELTENYPLAMGNAPASQAFPRFSIGPGQRFTSKGAYIARFSSSEPGRLEKVEDLIFP